MMRERNPASGADRSNRKTGKLAADNLQSSDLGVPLMSAHRAALKPVMCRSLARNVLSAKDSRNIN